MLMQRVPIIQTHSGGWSIGSADRREVTAAIQQRPGWPHRRRSDRGRSMTVAAGATDRHAASTAARRADDDIVKRPSAVAVRLAGATLPPRVATS